MIAIEVFCDVNDVPLEFLLCMCNSQGFIQLTFVTLPQTVMKVSISISEECLLVQWCIFNFISLCYLYWKDYLVIKFD